MKNIVSRFFVPLSAEKYLTIHCNEKKHIINCHRGVLCRNASAGTGNALPKSTFAGHGA